MAGPCGLPLELNSWPVCYLPLNGKETKFVLLGTNWFTGFGGRKYREMFQLSKNIWRWVVWRREGFLSCPQGSCSLAQLTPEKHAAGTCWALGLPRLFCSASLGQFGVRCHAMKLQSFLCTRWCVFLICITEGFFLSIYLLDLCNSVYFV